MVQGPLGQRPVRDRRGRRELTALDDLYREHPSGFVAARDRLAKELKDADDGEEAARVKKLRRPSAAAWVLNLVALTQRKSLGSFAKASQALETAQARALEGGDKEVEKWRAAAAKEREAAEAVLEAAEAAARDAGHPATKQALDQVDATLRAAAADPELREQVVAGRLEKERSAATIGMLGTPPPAPKRKAAAGKAKGGTDAKDSAKRREAAQASRELKRAERALDEASDREERRQAAVDDAAEALRQAKDELKDAKRETAELRRRAKALERKAKS